MIVNLTNLIRQVAPGSAARIRRVKTVWTNPEEKGILPELVSETDMWDGIDADEAAMQRALDWCVTWADGVTPPTAAELLAFLPDLATAQAKQEEEGALARQRQARMAKLNAGRVLRDAVRAGTIDKASLNPDDLDALQALTEMDGESPL